MICQRTTSKLWMMSRITCLHNKNSPRRSSSKRSLLGAILMALAKPQRQALLSSMMAKKSIWRNQRNPREVPERAEIWFKGMRLLLLAPLQPPLLQLLPHLLLNAKMKIAAIEVNGALPERHEETPGMKDVVVVTAEAVNAGMLSKLKLKSPQQLLRHLQPLNQQLLSESFNLV